MKTILLFSILFCAIALPLHAELTVQDLEKIDTKIQASEKRMKEHATEIEIRMKERVTQIEGHITRQVETIKNSITWLIVVFAALVAIIGIPLAILTILIGWRSIKDKSQEKQIETLTQEIETLKQQLIVNP